MRYLLGWLAIGLLVTGCLTYFRGERMTCFSPGGVDKCKPPPYSHPPVLYPGPPEAY